MKVTVLHSDLNLLGGAERVCLAFVETLKALGHQVTLVTMAQTNWHNVDLAFGSCVRPDQESHILHVRKRNDRFRRFLMYREAIRLREVSDFTINTSGYRWLPARADLVYEHTPPINLGVHTSQNIQPRLRAYYLPFDLAQTYFLSTERGKIITNSTYCSRIIRRVSRADIRVIHPPVDVSRFSLGGDHREEIVVTCGRYTQQKNYEMILNIGKRFPQVTFVIAGATNSLGATDYLAHLSALIEAKGIKNVHLMENVPIEELVALYGRAKIYLHAMVAEDFGVSVVEAMAAGLIPVVHRSGGVWEDVLQRGKFGFGYSDFNESLRCIETALASADDGRAALVEHAKAFDKKIFGRELALVLGETRRDRIEAQA